MSFLFRTAFIAAALLTGCSGADEPEVTLCGTPMKESEAQSLLTGNLFVSATYAENGRSAGELAGGLVATFIINGIDFSNPTYKPVFGNGEYSMKSGEFGYSLILTYAADVGGHRAGDRIAADVFDRKSYVADFTARVLPTPSIEFTPGPLGHLVEGSIDFDIKSPTDVKVKLRLRPELVAFELRSVGEHALRGRPPHERDVFTWKMTTTRATLADVQKQLEAGTYGLTFDGSRYVSPTYGVEQDFGASLLLPKKEGDRYHLEGRYDGVLRKDGRTFYPRAELSSRNGNATTYFCDPQRTEQLGVARHDLDLKAGTFTLADGRTLRYGLSPF